MLIELSTNTNAKFCNKIYRLESHVSRERPLFIITNQAIHLELSLKAARESD
jgi:hypothetical protein